MSPDPLTDLERRALGDRETSPLHRVWQSRLAAEERWDASASWDRVCGKAGLQAGPQTESKIPVGAKRAGEYARSTSTIAPRTRFNQIRKAAFWVWAVAGALAIGIWGGELSSRRNTFDGGALTFATPYGEQAKVDLPDGSTVFLNVASRLEIPADYSPQNRTVTLDGEAFFTVEHGSHAPFRVVTRHSTTDVLGTEFSVREYATDSSAVVAVESGRVQSALRDRRVDGAMRIISAGERMQILASGSVITGKVRDSDLSYRQQRLVIPSSTFRYAIPELNRWYGVEIICTSDRILDHTLQGEFERGSVSDIVAILRQTPGVIVRVEGTRIILNHTA